MAVFLTTFFILAAVALLVWIRLEGSIMPRSSTRAFWRLSSAPWYKKAEGYFYANRPWIYLRPSTWPRFMRLLNRWSWEGPDTYHSKIVVLDDARKIIMLDRPVELRRMDYVLPYPVARDLILNGPDLAIAVYECPCRALSPTPCLPTDVCLAVGEPFASFVVEHNPDKARMITRDEALDILEAEDKRGHIHTAWFKDALHDRFYALCNCCGCCCLGMKSYNRGIKRLTHSGYRPSINLEACNGCALCQRHCVFKAIEANPREKTMHIRAEACMGCGVCTSHCPKNALVMERDPHELEPLDLDRLTGHNGARGAACEDK